LKTKISRKLLLSYIFRFFSRIVHRCLFTSFYNILVSTRFKLCATNYYIRMTTHDTCVHMIKAGWQFCPINTGQTSTWMSVKTLKYAQLHFSKKSWVILIVISYKEESKLLWLAWKDIAVKWWAAAIGLL